MDDLVLLRLRATLLKRAFAARIEKTAFNPLVAGGVGALLGGLGIYGAGRLFGGGDEPAAALGATSSIAPPPQPRLTARSQLRQSIGQKASDIGGRLWQGITRPFRPQGQPAVPFSQMLRQRLAAMRQRRTLPEEGGAT